MEGEIRGLFLAFQFILRNYADPSSRRPSFPSFHLEEQDQKPRKMCPV